MMRTLWYAGLLVLAGIVLFACQSGDINVGQSVINPEELLVQRIDSVTIKTSTVLKVDSFATSSDNNIAVGQWNDSQTGQLTSHGFTSLDYPSNSLSSQTNLQLDSLVLELSAAFTYGDTTSAFTLNVHRLTRPLESQLYYNTSVVNYEQNPFLQIRIVPRPSVGTPLVRIKVPTALAQDFFAKLTSGAVNNSTTLSDYLPGFAFTSPSTSNTFRGYSVSSASTGLRLYYHSNDVGVSDLNKTNSNLLFPISNLHFTQLKNDRSKTSLNALQKRSDAVSSDQTNNTAFISWGAGLQARIELPYLSEFGLTDKYAGLNSALLVVSPVRRDLNDNTAPPSQLALYETNNQNEVIGTVPGTSSGGVAATATYYYDVTSPLLSDTYTFDLTYYLGQLLKHKIPNRPLLLTLPSTPTVQQLIQRVTIGNQNRNEDRMKLQLYLTSSQ